MSRQQEYRELEPMERRAAMMKVAGMSESVISHFLDCDSGLINAILKRPRVARYMIALESTFVTEIAKSAKILDTAILNSATRAFQIEKEVMERLFEKNDSIRAQLGAAATAQDILDRAGKRAPTKVLAEVVHTIDAEALGLVAQVLEESKTIDVTPRKGFRDAEEARQHARQREPHGVAGEEAPDAGPEAVHREDAASGHEAPAEDQGRRVA